MDGNWVKFHRKMLNWGWMNDPSTSHLFVILLLLANYKTTHWRGEVIKAGQLLTGRKQLSKVSGLSEQSIRTSLNRLKSTNEITSKVTNKFSIITIVNWGQYQPTDYKPTSTSTTKLTNNQPATNQQLTTSNKDKKDKNIKKEKKATSTIEDFKNYISPKGYYNYDLDTEWEKQQNWIEDNKPPKNYKNFWLNWMKKAKPDENIIHQREVEAEKKKNKDMMERKGKPMPESLRKQREQLIKGMGM